MEEYRSQQTTFGEDYGQLISTLHDISEVVMEMHDLNIRQNAVGRPSVEVEESRLTFFVENGFKVEEMALMLKCSKRTVEKKLRAYALSSRDYTDISDVDLDEILSQWCCSFPCCGVKMMTSKLRSQGIHVQRERIRQSMKRIDPFGIERRLRNVLHRRIYNVKCPNALWHIDGYHKLIRWRFVVHGAIDGYSRLITFLLLLFCQLFLVLLKNMVFHQDYAVIEDVKISLLRDTC